MELDRLVPKSMWIRKRSKTGLIQEKQGRKICPIRYQCLLTSWNLSRAVWSLCSYVFSGSQFYQ